MPRMMAQPENPTCIFCGQTYRVAVDGSDVYTTDPKCSKHMLCAQCHLHLKHEGHSEWRQRLLSPATTVAPPGDHHSHDPEYASSEGCGESDEGSCQYDSEATDHPIGANHYVAFDPSTGGLYKATSIVHTGSCWQVNLWDDGCGEATGENGLNRNDLQEVVQSLGRLGQGRLKQLRTQLKEEEDREKHELVKRRIGDGNLVEAHAHEAGISTHEGFIPIEYLEGFLNTQAAVSGFARVAVADWVFSRYVHEETREPAYAAFACGPLNHGSTGMAEHCRSLRDAYVGAQSPLV